MVGSDHDVRIQRHVLYIVHHEQFSILTRIVWISDPAYGNIRMPKSQLFEAWEEGERVLLTVSKRPFGAWKTRDDRVFLRRHHSEEEEARVPLGPMPIYKSIHQRMSRLSTFQ